MWEPGWYSLRKSRALYLGIVVAWLGSGLWLGPRFLAALPSPEGIVGLVLQVPMAAALAVFWYYALYHYGLVVATVIERRRGQPQVATTPARSPMEQPLVALLYPTADDFVEGAALSCVRQDYPHFQVFLLDDSRSEEAQELVERFQYRYYYRTSLVRREEHEGFKAGNLNHFMRTRGKAFQFFAIADADEVLPPDFLSRSVRYFEQAPWLGFVQANHSSAPTPFSSFATDLGDETRIRWEYNNLPRNRFGFPLFLGHGVVTRTEAWSAAGGFPEVVAEDVAFAVAMRRKGYRGLFAPEIVCMEGFPEDLHQLTRRHFRMVMGDTEALLGFGLPFLWCRGAGLAEKMDLITHTFRRAASGLVLPFVAGAILMQAVEAGGLPPLVGPGVAAPAGMPPAWDLMLIGLVGLTAPLARVLLEKRRTPLGALAHAARAIHLFMALAVESALAVIAFAVAGRAHFTVTGARAAGAQEGVRPGLRDRIARLDINHRKVIAASTAVTLLLLAFGGLTLNLVLAGVAVASVSMRLLAWRGWGSRSAHAVALLSVVLMLSGAVLGPLGVAGPPWQSLVLLGSPALVRT